MRTPDVSHQGGTMTSFMERLVGFHTPSAFAAVTLNV
jgi:hypothetical protein